MNLLKEIKIFYYSWFPRDWKDHIAWERIPQSHRPHDRRGYPPYKPFNDECETIPIQSSD